METKKMKVAELKPHPKNEEIYGLDEDISDLLEKIKRSNTVHTLVANSKNYILAGHRRRKVCIQLGIKSVDVEIRDFDSEEEEIEFIIDNNATRDKTAEQKSREAKALKEVESVLALKRKSIGGKGGFKDVANSPHLLKQEQDVNHTSNLLHSEIQDQGKSRDIVAKKVGLKSGREVERGIRTINTIDDLTENGRSEDAELLRGVLNNRSISAAEELAKKIDTVDIPDEDRDLIKAGKKSIYSLPEFARQRQKPETETKSHDEADPDKNLKYSRGCDIDKDQFALEQAQRLQVEVSSFSAKLNYFTYEKEVCRNMPPEYKEIILEQSGELIEKLNFILEHIKQKGDQEEPT